MIWLNKQVEQYLDHCDQNLRVESLEGYHDWKRRYGTEYEDLLSFSDSCGMALPHLLAVLEVLAPMCTHIVLGILSLVYNLPDREDLVRKAVDVASAFRNCSVAVRYDEPNDVVTFVILPEE